MLSAVFAKKRIMRVRMYGMRDHLLSKMIGILLAIPPKGR